MIYVVFIISLLICVTSIFSALLFHTNGVESRWIGSDEAAKKIEAAFDKINEAK